MIVVDSSTLILLAKIELLDLFIDASKQEISIPEEVENESCFKKTFDALLIERRIKEKKIKVLKVKNKNFAKKLVNDFNMDLGEAEAVALCLEKKAKILATDDKNAINACKVLKLMSATAIDILIRLYEKKIIDKETALIKLEKLKFFGRYSEKIINDAKNEVIKCKN